MKVRFILSVVTLFILPLSQQVFAEQLIVPLKAPQIEARDAAQTKDSITPDGNADTMAFEGSPGSNYCSSNQFEIGRYNGDQAIGYLDFQDYGLSSSVTITGISLRIYKNSEANNGTDHQFYFAQIDESWSECSVTWNNQPGVDNSSIYGPVDLSGGSGWYEIPLPLSYATNEFNSSNSWHGISIGPWRTNTDLLRFRSSEASSSRPFLIIEYQPGGTPDLEVRRPSSPSDAAIGGTISLSCDVENTGDDVAASSELGYYLSTNTVLDGFDIELGTDGVRSLDPGEDSSESITATLNHPSLNSGTYYILFVADLWDEVPEGSSGEGNNVTARAIDLHGPPSIGALEASDSIVFVGEPMRLEATGVADTDGDGIARVEFWWDSTQDNILDPATDYLLGTDTTPATWDHDIPAGNLVVGEMRFYAIAWDNYGLQSNTVSKTVRLAESLHPIIDFSKPNVMHTRGYIDSNSDGMHSPGEHIGSGIVGDDLSCWMAAAANLVQYRYGAADYDEWCEDGLVTSPIVHPFGGQSSANSGNRFTFDDGGFPNWVLRALDVPIALRITTTEQFHGGVWQQNPIAWCRTAIEDEDRPVALSVWWGDPVKGALPGWKSENGIDGYHAITLWGIDEASGQMLVSDSDDASGGASYVGSVRYDYEYENGVWIMHYDDLTAYVNYAVKTTTSALDITPVPDDVAAAGPVVLNLKAYPNPFNPRTRIRFDLAQPRTVSLSIYDVKGRRVKRIVENHSLPAGSWSFEWLGDDDCGRQSASGVYLYHLRAGDYEESRRLVLVE